LTRPFVVLAGLLGVYLPAHPARWAGRIHGRYAKWMLVGSLQTRSPEA